jgi:hypothetical protein
MSRFRLLLLNEIKLARTAIPIHIVAVLQPSILFLLLSLILVHPTFDFNILQSSQPMVAKLEAAMESIMSPLGTPYIHVEMIQPDTDTANLRQVLSIEEEEGNWVAVQHYNLIDSNQVKNLRNRLTASVLRLWNDQLGRKAVSIEEHTWLPEDLPYVLYFGMALLPFASFVSAVIIGGVLTAQDFEHETIIEKRIAPVSSAASLAAVLLRLVLATVISSTLLMATVGMVTGLWPVSYWRLLLPLLLVGFIGSCFGVTVGLVIRSSLPSFLVGLCLSLASWIFGSGMGLASGFGGAYEMISKLTPNQYAVELLFPTYYGVSVGTPKVAWLALAGISLGMFLVLILVYRKQVTNQQ